MPQSDLVPPMSTGLWFSVVESNGLWFFSSGKCTSNFGWPNVKFQLTDWSEVRVVRPLNLDQLTYFFLWLSVCIFCFTKPNVGDHQLLNQTKCWWPQAVVTNIWFGLGFGWWPTWAKLILLPNQMLVTINCQTKPNVGDHRLWSPTFGLA